MDSSETLSDARAPLMQHTEESVTVTCDGVTASLLIDADGGICYTPLESLAGVNWCNSCCGWGRCPSKHQQHQIRGLYVVGAALESPNTFRLWYYTPVHKSDPALAAPPFKLRKSLPFTCSSGTEALRLVQSVRQGASWHGRDKAPRVVAIINPSSGRGKAAKLFEREVAPVLEAAAGMSLTSMVTQHAAHATQLCAALNLSSVDMLVFVGGDGTVYEGLQGLLSRPDWDAARLLPIAHVPGGSGNGLANSCGLQDPATAAFCICKGVVSPMDVASVLQPPNRRMYIMLMATYGSMSNLDIGTEHLRWMGDTRFTLGTLWEIVKGRSYHASVAWLPAAEDQNVTPPNQPAAAAGTAAGSNSNSTNTPAAAAASPSGPPEVLAASGSRSVDAAADTDTDSSVAATQPASASVSLQNFPPGPELPLLQQVGDLLPLHSPQQQQQPGIAPSCLPAGWQLYQEPMQMWALFNPPFIAAAYKANPLGQLNSGHMDMMWLNGLTGWKGRLQALDVQVKSQQGLHVNNSCISQHKVCAMIFEPKDNKTCLMLDGELVPAAPIYLEVHKGLIRVLINPAHRAEPAADQSRHLFV